MTVIAPLPGDTGTEAVLMSADGSTIAGYSYDAATKTQRTFWWNAFKGVTQELKAIGGGVALMVPRALSADGTVIVGHALQGTLDFPGVSDVVGVHAFRWTLASGAIFIAPPGAGRTQNRAEGVSADGALTVGTQFDLVGAMEFRPMPFLSTNTVTVPFPLPNLDDGVASVVMTGKGTVIAGIVSGGDLRRSAPGASPGWASPGRSLRSCAPAGSTRPRADSARSSRSPPTAPGSSVAA